MVKFVKNAALGQFGTTGFASGCAPLYEHAEILIRDRCEALLEIILVQADMPGRTCSIDVPARILRSRSFYIN